MTTIVYTGDTITVQVVFKDTSGSLIDPDSNLATFSAYNNDNLALAATATMSRVSSGVYEYNWLIPSAEISYILEMKGLFATKPQLKRLKVRAKFRP